MSEQVTAQASRKKVSEVASGYMELDGAVKDGSCKVVDVPGGISLKRGCCNLYKKQKGADEFRCGLCQYVVEQYK